MLWAVVLLFNSTQNSSKSKQSFQNRNIVFVFKTMLLILQPLSGFGFSVLSF